MRSLRQRSCAIALVAFFQLWTAASWAAGGTIWHVNDHGPGDPLYNDPSESDPLEDGSIDHPFDAIQEAIDAATDGDEILVEPQGYYVGSGNHDIRFDGKAVTLRCVIPPFSTDFCEIGDGADPEQYYEVGVNFISDETAESVIEGFKFTGGTTAIRSRNSSPTIRDCHVIGPFFVGIDCERGSPAILDSSVALGPSLNGMRLVRVSDARIENCGFVRCGEYADSVALYLFSGSATIRGTSFVRNRASPLLISSWSNALVEDCLFYSNFHETRSGAVVVEASEATFRRVRAFSNESNTEGGAISIFIGMVTIENSLFSNNFGSRGGAIGITSGNSVVSIRNSTFFDNEAYEPGRGFVIDNPDGSEVSVRNSIVWNENFYGSGAPFFGKVDVHYSDVPGGSPGPTNISADPQFVAPYHYDPNVAGFQLKNNSPCINRGDPTYQGQLGDLDLGGAPRVQHCRLDMGAYETNVMSDCNANTLADSCEIHEGSETDCNFNDIPDTCDLDVPPVVFKDSIDFYDFLDPALWPIQHEVVTGNSGSTPGPSLELYTPDSFAETRSFDLVGAERATLAVRLAEDHNSGGYLDVDYWNGLQWDLLRHEVPKYTTQGNPTPTDYVFDLPREAMRYDARLRFRKVPYCPSCEGSWFIDNVVVTRNEGDCDGDGKIEACFAQEKLADDCNANSWPDTCETGQIIVGYNHLYNVGESPSSVTAGDFDRDGDVDLAIAHGDVFELGNVRLMIGDGQGAFTVAEDIPVGFWPRFITSADLNADGDLDLIVANGHSAQLTILENLGGLWWGFKPVISSFLGPYTQAVAVGDLDQDGDPDLAVSTGTSDGGPWLAHVLLNNGVGNFTTASSLPVGNAPRSITLFDADLDDDLDVAVTVQNEGRGVRVSLNRGNDETDQWQGLADFEHFPVGEGADQPFFVAAADFDRDGDDDLAVAVPNGDGKSGRIALLINDGPDALGRWKGLRKPTYLAAGSSPFDLEPVDLDLDGWKDLAAIDADGNMIRLFRNRRSGDAGIWLGLESWKEIPVGDRPTSLAIVDVNSDGVLDFVATNRATNNQGQTIGTPNVSVYLQTTPAFDCNGNERPDDCDITAGESIDCNDDGVPDECQKDCDGNRVPDDCDLRDATAPDCNKNGAPDSCDVASGMSQDCDDDRVPDECESLHTFLATSGFLSQIGKEEPQQWTVPLPPPAASDVMITIVAEARLGPVPSDYHIDILLNGYTGFQMYGGTTSFCPRVHRGDAPYSATFSMPSNVFNELVAGGDAVFDVTTPEQTWCSSVFGQPRYSLSYAKLTLSYPVANARDCNDSSAPDPCDFSSGYSLDLNVNDVPDECDDLGDRDASGQVDVNDLIDLPQCLQGPAKATPKACESYDFNLDGAVDLIDLRGFLMVFGRP